MRWVSMQRALAALLVMVGMAAGWGGSRAEAAGDGAAAARFRNLAYVYPRGVACPVRLEVSGADAVEFDVSGWLATTVPVRDGAAEYRVDTLLLREGDYDVRARLMRNGRQVGEARMPLTVAVPRDPERLPVWNWLGIGGARGDDEILTSQVKKDSGFTGGLIGWRVDPTEIPSGRTSDMVLLDQAARLGFDGGFALDPYHSKTLQSRPELRGVFSDGAKGNGIYPRAPEALDFARRTADSWIAALGEFPALRYLFLSSEIDPPLAPHPEAVRLAREEAGLDLGQLPIMSEAGEVRAGMDAPATHGRLKVTPAQYADGIVPDNDPTLRFLKWWWEGGQGTAALNLAMSQTAKARRPDLISFHDPYRIAPVRHSHRGLDLISTWTYGTPDIKRLVYTTYLQAAARADNLRVNQTITFLLCDFEWMITRPDFKRDYTVENWEGDRHWLSAGPDYCLEATWLVLSQRPDVLSYYEAGINEFTNVRTDPNANQPETLGAIAQVTRELVKPYGPAILDTERLTPRVALLASAVGVWYHVGGFNMGWMGEQTLPYAGLLAMNHVPFDVLLDDDVAEGAASRYAVLVLPFNPVVTETMAKRLREFVAGGGRVIVNEPFRFDLPGAIRTRYDFTFEFHTRGNTAAKDFVSAEEHRRRMEAYAADLRKHLAGGHGPVRPSSARVLTNTLEGGDVRYHFLINDDRCYGPRFGKYEVRFETSRPQMATVSIADTARPVLYDAVRRKPIETTPAADGALRFTLALPKAGGKLVAALPEAIDRVDVTVPQEAALGKAITLRIRVLGKSGRPLKASLPLRVDIEEPWGRRSEWSRYATTRREKDGVCEFTFVPGVNEIPGAWTIFVRDLIGDKTAQAKISVADSAPAASARP